MLFFVIFLFLGSILFSHNSKVTRILKGVVTFLYFYLLYLLLLLLFYCCYRIGEQFANIMALRRQYIKPDTPVITRRRLSYKIPKFILVFLGWPMILLKKNYLVASRNMAVVRQKVTRKKCAQKWCVNGFPWPAVLSFIVIHRCFLKMVGNHMLDMSTVKIFGCLTTHIIVLP